MRESDDITGAIVDASVRVNRDLGPELVESVHGVFVHALEPRGFQVER